MRVAVVAPEAVPATYGGAERLTQGLLRAINERTPHDATLVTLPSPERTFREIVDSYQRFSRLDLSDFDLVISGKYPAWMVDHPRHHIYLLHPLRGLYDTYHLFGAPTVVADTEQREVERALGALGSRDHLPRLFDALGNLLATRDDDHPALAFPGPLIRDVVHALDRVALWSGQIQRLAAISATVTRRPGPLPPDRVVHVAHPPSDLAEFERGRFGDLFTVSRLDAPKRIDLLVAAMRHVEADIRLRIAGTGPQRDRLEELAAADSRIEFLGFVSDDELITRYAHACAVPFVPLDEDFGLVAYEAGMAGKPVITTVDSGGPRELVSNGRTGLVVEPTPEALGAAMSKLAGDPAWAEVLGRAAHRRVQGVTWDAVTDAVLGQQPASTTTPSRIRHRSLRRSLAPRIVVMSTFPVHPRRGGGQLRAFHLYGALAPVYDVEILSFSHPDDGAPGWYELGPSFREHVVQKTPEHLRSEELASASVGISVGDIVAAKFASLTPQFEIALGQSLAGASAVILCHPFLAPLVRPLRRDIPVIYDAHNAEIALKDQVLGDGPAAGRLLAEVRQQEAAACRESELIAVVSANDAAILRQTYQVPADKMVVISNGINTEARAFVPMEQRLQNKTLWQQAFRRRTGLKAPDHVAIFVASWHPPNIAAAEAIIAMAPDLPDIQFFLVGGHTQALDPRTIPGNVTTFGVVSDTSLVRLLATADVGLNMMESGGGSNLKLFEYLAVGLPVVTTAIGARGFQGSIEECFTVATREDFPDAIRRLVNSPERARKQTEAGRKAVESSYDWEVLAAAFRQRLRRVVKSIPFDSPPPAVMARTTV